MTSAELISSGILEAYILGVAGPEDELIVSIFLSDPQIVEELGLLSRALEHFALESAITPPDWGYFRYLEHLKEIG